MSFIILVALWGTSLGLVMPLAKDIQQTSTAPAPVQLSGPCDFTMFWAVGRMANAGQAADIFTPQNILSAEVFPENPHIKLLWFYPPPALLLVAPAGHVTPFFRALYLWIAGVLLLSVLVLRRAGLAWPVIAAAALSPAGLLNADLGQLGFLTGALTIAGMLLADKRPALAGSLFGALAFKPQAAMLGPVLLLARGQWRGIAGGAAVALAMCGLSLALWGPAVWHNFLGPGLRYSHFVLIQPFPRHPPPVDNSNEFYGVSVFWMCRSFGWSVRASSLVQSLAVLGALAVCWWAWRQKNANPIARVALTACLALFMTPYGYLYDLGGTSIAIAALAWQERRLVLTDVLLFGWPVLGLLIALKFYLELAPVMLCLAAWRAAKAMRRT
jgi:alpha-1,2-mannosyltransferase